MRVLVIRFSSIGDILMTTPVFRVIKKQLPSCEVHFVTKACYAFVTQNNPHINQTHLLYDGGLFSLLSQIRRYKYDYVIDLHGSLRSFLFCRVISPVESTYVVKKQRSEKKTILRTKKVTSDIKHASIRALDTLAPLGVTDDGKGLAYYFSKSYTLEGLLPAHFLHQYIALVIGGSAYTRRLPVEQLTKITNELAYPVILLGGTQDAQRAMAIVAGSSNKHLVNGCGVFSFDASAYLIKEAQHVITHDTALMHVAASFDKKIVSIWGHNVPEFGHTPFRVSHHRAIQVEGLDCRPCTLHGSCTCPKKHFNCMKKINIAEVVRFFD